MFTVGIYLRTLRTADGLTQADVAQRIGINAKTVERWEAGTHEPAFTDLERYIELVRGSLLRVVYYLTTSNVDPDNARDAAKHDRKHHVAASNEERQLMEQLMQLTGERRQAAIAILRQLLAAEGQNVKP